MAATPYSHDDHNHQHDYGTSFAELPKSWHFTSSLPPDPLFPTPAASHATPRADIRPREVRGALFSWVRPERQPSSELLAVSPAAMRDLGLAQSEAESEDFAQTCVGNVLHGWDPENGMYGYPWAQRYGGYQFGLWAGQLGDGRAISLFETLSPGPDHGPGGVETRYEVQLKGAGITPYSRFADGQAVFRSSLREFIASEALHALGVPTTRALALSLLPIRRVQRETLEPGAIVVRFAQSWLRLGTFDMLRHDGAGRGAQALNRRLATYVAEDVFGGWDELPGRLEDPRNPDGSPDVRRDVGEKEIEGPEGTEENRFTRLYREIARRNALTVAKWQAYGFMNGVLNTDNTSVMGLSLDFGPFAFMDNFNASFTPNHDDHVGRYSYRNQPSVIWWNLARLGEDIWELIASAALCDDYDEKGDDVDMSMVDRAGKLILQVADEYRAVFMTEYKRLMTLRLGLRHYKEADFEGLYGGLLDIMEALELDFNHFFRRLSALPVSEIATEEERREQAARFFHQEGFAAPLSRDQARATLGEWLGKWRARIVEDWPGAEADGDHPNSVDQERMQAMKRVNPNFTPRNWILEEVIRRVEKEGERDVLRRLVHMTLHPFEDSWDGRTFDGVLYEGDPEEEDRWIGDVPMNRRALQCSCSS